MELTIEQFFDRHTMSVHLRENLPPLAKRGRPGEWKLEEISPEPMTWETVAAIADEILEYVENHDDAVIEDDWEQARIIQLRDYRIVITTYPFSNALEITAVKPTMRKTLESYSLDRKLFERLSAKAEGILIAGSPGAGKSTFGAALADFYASQGKIVKTIEKPRDLNVDDRITQYQMIDDDPEKTGDILLLMRPDYVIYDEVRKSRDFEVYSDLRLSGIGLVGVVHATNPMDAIQRFIGRIELGLIPSIIDTVIFIEKGEVTSVYSLKMTVKVPTGMQSNDLARPVIVVGDFLNNDRPAFELFSFGEQVVLVPVGSSTQKRRQRKLPLDEIRQELEFLLETTTFEVEQIGNSSIRLYIPSKLIPSVIGKNGSNIRELEKYIGLSIDIEPLDIMKDASLPDTSKVRVYDEKKHLVLDVGSEFAGRNVDIMVGPQVIFSGTVDYSGQIRLSKKKGPTKRIEKMLASADSPLTVRARK
ncbi:MAG: ATPase [Methanobacteriota archaeon]|nr:MAG: ATPase [Euryarchaeota archaeon]